MPQPLPDQDVTSAITKTQAYLKAHPAALSNIQIEGNKDYGIPAYTFTLPKDFPIDGKNKNEVAAFVRALYCHDPALMITNVSYDEAGQPTFRIQTRDYVGDKINATLEDESKERQPFTDKMQEQILKALTAVGHDKEPQLRHHIQQLVNHEQKSIDATYSVTRSATVKAFAEHNHVVVLGDQILDQKFVYQYRAALDGANQVQDLAAVRLNTSQSSLTSYFPKHPDSYLYADAVNQALAMQQKGVEVIGDYNHFEDRSAKAGWNEKTNAQKQVLVAEAYRQNYADMDRTNAQYADKKTLTLSTDFPLVTDDVVVLNGAKEITTTQRKEYYVMRFNDGQTTGPHSEEALKSQYPGPDGKTNIDISGGHDEQLFYAPIDMERNMYETAKLKYVSHHAGLTHEKDAISAPAHADPHFKNAPTTPAQQNDSTLHR